MPQAILRNGKRFDVDVGASILSAALGQGIFLDYSCRTGHCGFCKARVVSGETVVLQPEESLASQDQAVGHILTCCRGAQDNVVLDLSDLGRLSGLQPRTVPARIASIGRLSPTIMRVTLRFPPTTAISFLPGQYLDVLMHGVRSSYSIANSPREDRTIDLDIREFKGSKLSAYWFGKAAVGDLLRVELPLGTFFLREDRVETILFLATGTGIASVRAMLAEIMADPAVIGNARIRIYWGNRSKADFYWSPPAGGVVDFHPILSRPDGDWAGRQGYVQDAVVADGINLSKAMVYACGSQAMIDAAGAMFKDRGLPRHHYHFDAFVSSGSVE
jgi:CDP-4-dehydro-6-deoxyglucose reductase